MFLKSIISILLFLFTIVNGELRQKSECNHRRQQEIDRYSLKLNMFGDVGRQYPVSLKELKPYCDESLRMINAIDRFTKECYTSDVQNMAKIFVYSTKRTAKQFCTKKNVKRAQKLIKFAPCINPYLPKDQCLLRFMDKVRGLIPYQMNNDKISYTCCYFVDLLKCFDESMSKLSCMTEEGREAFFDLIHALNGDMVNFACGEYTEQTDRCQELKPLNKYKLSSDVNVDKRYKSFFFTSIAMFESMGENGTQINPSRYKNNR